MREDFALVDFALVAAAPERVVPALGQVHALQARAGAAAAAARGQPRTTGARPGLLSRLLRRGGGVAAAPAPLLLQPEGHLPPPPLARLMLDGLGFGAGATPFRVTAPVGEAELALVEFREADAEHSPVCAALSAELPGTEVFRFRLSGARHPGAETAFHVYLDGHAVRRTASISTEGTAPEAPWRVVDTGIPHPVEADSLPHARARAWEVMTPARQGAILAAMGVEPDTLFDPLPGRVAIVLSPAEGGRPLSYAARLFRAARPDAAPDGPSPGVPPGTPAETADPLSLPATDRPEPTAAPGPGASPAAETAGTAPGELRDATWAENTRAPSAATPAAPPSTPGAPGAGAEDEAGTSWEAEVTAILVAAVAHALPEQEQVPWLTALTARLEAGDVADALDEARALIARGDRPEAERAADAARLDALFGVDRG
ncbi:MAG: hypothetical protein V2I65_18310 [Paracoccaceae bacterium]|jgi:hypothetical protein|nr:hypothetical protein [Paracoccaceae bacterium]